MLQAERLATFTRELRKYSCQVSRPQFFKVVNGGHYTERPWQCFYAEIVVEKRGRAGHCESLFVWTVCSRLVRRAHNLGTRLARSSLMDWTVCKVFWIGGGGKNGIIDQSLARDGKTRGRNIPPTTLLMLPSLHFLLLDALFPGIFRLLFLLLESKFKSFFVF